MQLLETFANFELQDNLGAGCSLAKTESSKSISAPVAPFKNVHQLPPRYAPSWSL